MDAPDLPLPYDDRDEDLDEWDAPPGYGEPFDAEWDELLDA
jgi:hypothetical protein